MLGIYAEKNLCFEYCFALKRLSSIFNFKSLRIRFYTVINSLLLYASICWALLHTLNRLFVKQKKLLDL